MSTVDAAVVRKLGEPPEFGEFEEPVPGEGEVLLTVKAAALNPSTRATASGAHYASQTRVPYVVGLDGVGVLEDGTGVFFGGPRPPFGTFARKAVAHGPAAGRYPTMSTT